MAFCFQRDQTDRLRFLTVNTMDMSECRGQLTKFQRSYVRNETVCSENGHGQGLGHGDYGTGLISTSNGKLMGIATIFMFSANGGMPDVFIRVAPYADWIDDIISDLYK